MLIYLASPYSSSDPRIVESRYNAVLNFTAQLIHKGFLVYSPIVHNHYIAKLLPDYLDKLAFNFWERLDTKMISRCDQLWVLKLEGWNESKGIAAEIKFANSLDIQVQYIEPNQERFITRFNV